MIQSLDFFYKTFIIKVETTTDGEDLLHYDHSAFQTK